MLNIVSIIDNYTNRLNDIFDISDESKKNFVNRNVLMINKFFDLSLKEERRLFLSNFLNCIRSVINSNLMFQNNTTSSIQQITFDIFVFFIRISVSFTKNKNINILKIIYIDFAILVTNIIVNVIKYLKIQKFTQK